jgi:hypothetical protein
VDIRDRDLPVAKAHANAEPTVLKRRETGVPAGLDSAQRRLADERQPLIGIARVEPGHDMPVAATSGDVVGGVPLAGVRRDLLQGDDIGVEARELLTGGVQPRGLTERRVPEVPGCDLHSCSPAPGTTSTACGQGWIRNGPHAIASRIERSSAGGLHSIHHLAAAAIAAR